MAENGWTQLDEAILVFGFQAGITPDRMAEALRKTPGSVRWKLNQLGLAKLPCAPPGTPKPQPQYDEQHRNDRRGDLAFKRAMLSAMSGGAERARLGVIRSCAARYVRHIIPEVESGYRSSAGYTADMGVDRGGTNGSGGG
jgi:hypothetical protein